MTNETSKTAPQTASLAEIDLSSHDAFLERVPHEWFRVLRREAPVFFNPEPDGPGFYAVTRYADIREVHKDFATYSSEVGGTSLEDLEPDQIEARKSMIDTDPPRHKELRGLIARRFTSRSVKVWEDAVKTVAKRVIGEALPKGEMDFVREISSEIPMQVFAEILGVPREDRRLAADAHDEAHRLLPFSSPVSLEMFEFGRKLAEARRRSPTGDIISLLVSEDLTQREFDVYFVLLATAGNETTRHTITHGLLALLEYPEQLARLRNDPALSAPAAEEMLRWATAVHYFRRTTMRDTVLAGTEIPAGSKVATWLVSGNRDETVFDDPDAFDVGRDPNKHMAFGPGGIHHCLGAHLARLEVKVVFEELLARTDRIELMGPPERLRSNFFNGIKRLPVRFT
jgi:cytochrome P450